MLIFHDEQLVVFSIPRTGSTSLHKALRPYADIEFSNPPNKKHMNVRRFETWATTRRRRVHRYHRVAVVREPLARMVSWYQYRKRDAVAGQPSSTRGMDFNAFVRAVLEETPPPPAQIGNQHSFLIREDGSLGVDDLFCLERPDLMEEYFGRAFGLFHLPHRNASEDSPLELDPALEAQLRVARAEEFALFDRVARAGRLTLTSAAAEAPEQSPAEQSSR